MTADAVTSLVEGFGEIAAGVREIEPIAFFAACGVCFEGGDAEYSRLKGSDQRELLGFKGHSEKHTVTMEGLPSGAQSRPGRVSNRRLNPRAVGFQVRLPCGHRPRELEFEARGSRGLAQTQRG